MDTKTIADIELSGKKVLMRVDFNVPLENGEITDDTRIQAALPSIKKVLESGGRLVAMSHLGRPKGKVQKEFSLAPAAKRLGELVGKEVVLGPPEIAGKETSAIAGGLQEGEILLLENLRCESREDSKDEAEVLEFGKQLAALGDAYVNDAFGTCHRKHASMWAAPQAIREKGGDVVAGYLVEKEIVYLSDAVDNPRRPFVAVLGGAKVSDKIKLINSLLEKVDRILIGGAMAYTLLKAGGASVGKSLVEEDQVGSMKTLLEQAKEKIILPSDHVCVEDFGSDDAVLVEAVDIPDNLMGMDIGPDSQNTFTGQLSGAGTIVWNGPMGVFEREPYATGTRVIAEAVANATDSGTITVIGGGDSAAAVEQMGLSERMTHVSTGGGASLTFLEGKPMPPIEILDVK